MDDLASAVELVRRKALEDLEGWRAIERAAAMQVERLERLREALGSLEDGRAEPAAPRQTHRPAVAHSEVERAVRDYASSLEAGWEFNIPDVVEATGHYRESVGKAMKA